MTDSSPSRKRPRITLKLKSTSRIGSLFQRRWGIRQGSNSDDQVLDSDSEDNEPILSRITTTALTQPSRSPPKKAEFAYGHDENNNRQATHLRRDNQNHALCEDGRGDGEDKHSLRVRRGLGMGPTNHELLEFQSQNIVSQGRPLAFKPASGDNYRDFTFEKACPTSLMGDQLGPNPARSREPVLHERTNPLRKFLFSEPRRTATPSVTGKALRTAHDCPKPGPLDHLKLRPSQPSAPRLDQPADITDINDYIRPRLHVPDVQAEVYRNKTFSFGAPAELFNVTVPNWTEVAHFVKDCEGANVSELTQHGDVPVVSKPEGIRVPVGARRSAIGNNTKLTGDGDTTMTDVSPISLPPHVHRRKKRFKEKPKQDDSNSDNAYTSSQRILDAYLTVKYARKRKRLTDPAVLPPPDYVYQRTGRGDFNIFRDGFLRLPELCLALATHLPVQTLISLYSISKDFHIIVNQRFTTVVLNQASLKAPNAVRCYPWRCFKNLSQPDPALRAQTSSLSEQLTSMNQKHGNMDGVQINVKPAPAPPDNMLLAKDPHLRPHTRRVPTFRWLLLAIHREKVIHALYHAFASRGVPLPGDPEQSESSTFCNSLHKLWFIFDVPDNPRRIQLVHTPSLISDDDLVNIMTFVVKLDMICNSPIGAEKRDGLRKLLMSSCDGFDTILKVIRREEWRTGLDMLRAWTRYGFQLDREGSREQTAGGGWVPLGLSPEEHMASNTVFGIPKEEVSKLKREFWGEAEYDRAKRQIKTLPPGMRHRFIHHSRTPMYLIRPDQLVLREIVKRGYTFEKNFLDAVLEGYIDFATFEPVPPRDLNAGRSRVLENEGEYDVNDAVSGLRALSVEEGGDDLLDLGNTRQASSLTLQQDGPREAELKHRKAENELLQGYMAAWREEVEAERIKRASMAYRILG